jgi:uncharacterized protein (DUF433 family)
MTITPKHRRADSCGAYSWKFQGWDYARSHTTFKNLDISFASVLHKEINEFAEIEMTPSILGGTPRITGTRIPVSMILDAIQFHGDLKGALKSYPDLTMDQVRQAISFSAAVLECRSGEEKS